MTVYVVGCKGTRRVKIGSTEGDPAKRLAALQSGSPYPLRLLWVSTPEHGAKTETTLHRLFWAYRRQGEWFDLGDADPVALASAAVDLPPLKPIDRETKCRYRAESRSTRLDKAEYVPTPSLLQDLDDVLGDLPIPAAKVAAMLAGSNPDRYRQLTGKSLCAHLALLSMKVPSTDNRYLVSPATVRKALATKTSHLIDSA